MTNHIAQKLVDQKLKEFRVDDKTRECLLVMLEQADKLYGYAKRPHSDMVHINIYGDLKALFEKILQVAVKPGSEEEGSPLHIYLLDYRVQLLAGINVDRHKESNGYRCNDAIKAQFELQRARGITVMKQMKEQMRYYFQFGNDKTWLKTNPKEALEMLVNGLEIYDFLSFKLPEYERGLRLVREDDCHAPLLSLNNAIELAISQFSNLRETSKKTSPRTERETAFEIQRFEQEANPLKKALTLAASILVRDAERLSATETFIKAERYFKAARCHECLEADNTDIDRGPETKLADRGIQAIKDAINDPKNTQPLPYKMYLLEAKLSLLGGKASIRRGHIGRYPYQLWRCKQIYQSYVELLAASTNKNSEFMEEILQIASEATDLLRKNPYSGMQPDSVPPYSYVLQEVAESAEPVEAETDTTVS